MRTLIDTNIRIFSLLDTVQEAITYLGDKKFTHAIVVDDAQFLGVFSLEELLDFNKENTLQSYAYQLKNECVFDNKHWLHTFHLFDRFRANIIAVVDAEFRFVGTYQMDEFSKKITQLPLVEKPGVVLVVQGDDAWVLNEKMVKIVSDNQGLLLGMFPTDLDSEMVELTLKIDSMNSDKILEAIRREGIQLLYSDTTDFEGETLQDNADYFNTYLSI
jgi:hypothetical protein